MGTANHSTKNHNRNVHGKSTGFYRGAKGKHSRSTADHGKHTIKALSGYEQLRNKVMETAEAPIQNVNQVASAIKKPKVNAGI